MKEAKSRRIHKIKSKFRGSVRRRIAGSKTALRKIKSIGSAMKKIHRTKIFHISKLKFGRFKPKIKIFIEKGNFIIKTVETARELENILRLRFKVFYQEILEKNAVLPSDVDIYDFICDHLVVFDKEKQKYVGTYRLNLSSFSKKFYSAQEFDINNILRLPDIKLELGRACVDKEYRTGVIIGLLWRGLVEYIRASNARYLFGCSSVKTTDIKEASLLYLYLMKNHKAPDELLVTPRKNFRIPSFSEYAAGLKYDSEQVAYVKKLMPPLLSFYIKAGAFICGEPALDKAFQCVDFFTLLDLNNLTKEIERRYRISE
ncbi:MAG: GNAT family N-acetyltransferase [Candidatus Omnitrophica bacterium]|nr:GNAT family N-acetyltransferase [Candidatus Omnitrophota bacterium]